jgi:hypothetical protein
MRDGEAMNNGPTSPREPGRAATPGDAPAAESRTSRQIEARHQRQVNRSSREPVLRRLDRMLAGTSGPLSPAYVAASSGGSLSGAGELEDLFAFWASCDAANPVDPRPNYPVMGLSLVFVCAVSAAAISMVMPYTPSVSQVTDFLANAVPGYDQYQGVPTLAPARLATDNSGIHTESFVLHPAVETGFGYNDNVLGGRGSPSSIISSTKAVVAVNSDWDRNAIGAYLSADTEQYLDTPQQSQTNWTAAIGGTYTIGRGDLTFAYSHLYQHQGATSLNSVATTTPVPFTLEDLRAIYAVKLGDFTLTPNIDLSLWNFGTATIDGQRVDQKTQDRDVLQAGLAVGYDLSSRTSILGNVSVIDSHYLYSQPGAPAPSAISALGQAGIDYRFSGALRMRMLLGLEAREFQSATYRSRVAPIGQASLIWTPSGLTTVTATLSRSIEDAVQASAGGYTYSRADIAVTHDLYRDVQLNARIGVQDSEPLQANVASQTSVFAGVGATWQINRNISLTMSYQYTSQSGGTQTAQPTANGVTSLGAYNANVVDVRLRAAL